MPDLNALITMLPLPIWAAGALLILFLLTCVTVVRRSGSSRPVAVLFGIPALVVIAWSAWSFADHAILRDRAAEREALAARALQLTTAAIVPGSPLACLDAVAGAAVEASCEAALFLKPETVAAATAYVEAKLRLLADSLDYSHRADRAYGSALAGLRRAIEADRYGFVAHVLAARDGCTPDACEAFALFRDASAVKANLTAQTYENKIARHAVDWPDEKKAAPAAVAAPPEMPPAATLSAVPVTKPIDFPSAASIPPVNIMSSDPAEPPASPTAQAAPPSRPASPPPARRPAAANAAAPARTTPPASAAATPAARPQ